MRILLYSVLIVFLMGCDSEKEKHEWCQYNAMELYLLMSQNLTRQGYLIETMFRDSSDIKALDGSFQTRQTLQKELQLKFDSIINYCNQHHQKYK